MAVFPRQGFSQLSLHVFEAFLGSDVHASFRDWFGGQVSSGAIQEGGVGPGLQLVWMLDCVRHSRERWHSYISLLHYLCLALSTADLKRPWVDTGWWRHAVRSERWCRLLSTVEVATSGPIHINKVVKFFYQSNLVIYKRLKLLNLTGLFCHIWVWL